MANKQADESLKGRNTVASKEKGKFGKQFTNTQNQRKSHAIKGRTEGLPGKNQMLKSPQEIRMALKLIQIQKEKIPKKVGRLTTIKINRVAKTTQAVDCHYKKSFDVKTQYAKV